MTDGFVLGVDLGTSHTVAMLRWPDGRTRPLLFDGQPLLPSAGYLDTTGRLHVGRDAVRLGQAEPGRLEPNPKRHVDAETVLLGGAEVPTADLLAALLGAVAREAVAATGFLPPAVLTYPAAWGSRRRSVLTTALARAGWPSTTRLVAEPIAAARYFADVLRRPVPVGSALAVFDFGGGTLDIAVVRNEGVTPQGQPRFAVAASGGVDDLGGLDLDAALVAHLGTTLEKDEPAAWAALTEPVTLAQWRARRQFWEDVRGAKEMLSRTALAPVPVPGVEQAVRLTREEFEAAAGPLLRRGVAEAGSVLRAAGLDPADLAGLFLVGGSSRVPLVARLLHSELGIAPTVLEQPELPVAEGAIIASAAPSSDAAPAPAAGAAPAAAVAAEAARTPAEPMRAAAVPPATDTMAPGGQPEAVAPAPPASGNGAAPPVARPAGDQPNYAEPVDPWATGEAAAFGNAGGPVLHPVSGAPHSHTPRRPGVAPGRAVAGLDATRAGAEAPRVPEEGSLDRRGRDRRGARHRRDRRRAVLARLPRAGLPAAHRRAPDQAGRAHQLGVQRDRPARRARLLRQRRRQGDARRRRGRHRQRREGLEQRRGRHRRPLGAFLHAAGRGGRDHRHRLGHQHAAHGAARPRQGRQAVGPHGRPRRRPGLRRRQGRACRPDGEQARRARGRRPGQGRLGAQEPQVRVRHDDHQGHRGDHRGRPGRARDRRRGAVRRAARRRRSDRADRRRPVRPGHRRVDRRRVGRAAAERRRPGRRGGRAQRPSSSCPSPATRTGSSPTTWRSSTSRGCSTRRRTRTPGSTT
nr:hypothetical protein GCM10020092_007120 [Actinoplanes digitatis]